jgi:DNA repair exonuclease SbcCD nuclease subunit
MNLLKLLHFADLHFSPGRADTCFKILEFIGQQAQENKIDAIIFSGDLCEKALLNSYSHYLPQLQTALTKIAIVAPIFMIYGTDYHDPPGSLEVFSNNTNNIHIVRPNIPYGYRESFFYYIPDVRPETIKGNTGKYYDQLCISYAAHRKEHPNNYAIVIGHGSVLGADPMYCGKIRERGAVSEQQLAIIHADAYLWGHEHHPIDFKNIPGGYAGSFAQSWKELDYKPRIGIVTIEKPGIYKREEIAIPFIPKRIKIELSFKNMLNVIEIRTNIKNSIVWIEREKQGTITKQDLIDAGAHPDSIVTTKAEPRQPIRNAIIHTLNTYRDLYQSYKSDATEKELEICDDIQRAETNQQTSSEKRKIVLKHLYIKRLKQLFDETGKEEFEIDFDNCRGLTGIIGRGGIGKTSILLCIPPHTISMAQENSISSMFEHGGFIFSTWLVNEQLIETKRIFSVTAASKTETAYQISIQCAIEKSASGSRENYDRFVNAMFGSPRMFALTVFRPQFPCYTEYQEHPINPDLFTLSNSDFKSIISELTNCSKDFAWKYCMGNTKEAENEKRRAKSRLDYFLEESQEQAIEKICEIMEKQIINLESDLFSIEKKIKQLENELKSFQTAETIMRAMNENKKASETIKMLNAQNNTLKAGCERCGYINDATKEIIKSNDNAIKDLKESITQKEKIIFEKKHLFPENCTDYTESDFKQLVLNADCDLKETKEQYFLCSTRIKSLQDDYKRIQQLKTQLTIDQAAAQAQYNTTSSNLELWEGMTKAWHRDGIPAMILENVAPEIDQIVNDLLDQYYPRIQIMTSTLKGNKENFHIDVYKQSTGRIYPFSALSGEERNFLDATFREACRRIYERTGNIIYNFTIDDEPDSSIGEDALLDFWDMKRELAERAGRLNICVSHSPNAKQAFTNTIVLESL